MARPSRRRRTSAPSRRHTEANAVCRREIGATNGRREASKMYPHRSATTARRTPPAAAGHVTGRRCTAAFASRSSRAGRASLILLLAGHARRHARLSNRVNVMQIGRTIARRARPEPCGITDDAPQPQLATARAVCAIQSSDVHLTAYAPVAPDHRLEHCEREPRLNLSGDLSKLRAFGPLLSWYKLSWVGGCRIHARGLIETHAISSYMRI